MNTKVNKAPERAKPRGRERKKEILGILIMAFAVLIFLGLVSFRPADYPNSGHPSHVSNWLGLAGAWISHYLYVYTIGYACLIFPFLVFLLGWNLFLEKPFKPFLRLAAYVLALGLFLSTALAMPEAVQSLQTRFGAQLSGLFGLFIAEHLNRYLGTAGAIVVLLTFLILFLVSATSWSMREAVLGLTQDLKTWFRSLSENMRRKNALRAEARQAAAEKKASERPPGAIPSGQVERPPVQRPPIEVFRTGAPSGAAGRPGVSSPQSSDLRSLDLRPPAPSPSSKAPGPHSQAPRQAGEHPPQGAGAYRFPSLDLLAPVAPLEQAIDRHALEEKAKFLEQKLREFDVEATVTGIQPGPVITRFEVAPDPGVKVSRFIGIQDDLALVMKASRVRIVAPIPGKAAVGIEIPNDKPALVSLRSILESPAFQRSGSRLTLALGYTIEGQPYVVDLAQMPHLLVAGATGSGKSVCLNAIIMSLLFRAKPSDIRLVLIDPKKLELTLYQRLKNHHLTTREDLNEDVITTLGNAVSVLRSLGVEMERRYRALARIGVRHLEDYNRAVAEGKVPPQEEGKPPRKFPYIVLIVDELADLMATGARDIEEPIARLAQMSRAVGIHLILATQRPSVDVITGVIKANFPSRIAFQVVAKTDSRTILDRNGAEKLLGRGDMLFMNPRQSDLVRVHGAMVSTEEVERVVAHIAAQPQEEPWALPGAGPSDSTAPGKAGGEQDELFREAAKLVIRHQQGSASLLQRRLRVGYARAGRLIDELEAAGILGPFDGSKARELLVDETFLDEPNGSAGNGPKRAESEDEP